MRRLSLLLALAGLAGCSDAFDPFVPAASPFALVGSLDARQDTQFVRVEVLAERDRDPQLGDARLTSTDEGTGAVRVWTDSLVTLRDGSVGLVAFAVFRPEAGAVYRIEAEAPDGARTRALVAMPRPGDLVPEAPREVAGVVSQLLTLAGAEEPERVTVTYTVRRTGTERRIDFDTDYTPRPPIQGVGFDLLVGLSRDADRIRSIFGILPGETDLLAVRLRYEIEDPARGVVENGRGALGAAAAFEQTWTLPTATVEAIGFRDFQPDGDGD